MANFASIPEGDAEGKLPYPSFPCFSGVYQRKPSKSPRILCSCRIHDNLGEDREKDTKITKEIPCLNLPRTFREPAKGRTGYRGTTTRKNGAKFSGISVIFASFLPGADVCRKTRRLRNFRRHPFGPFSLSLLVWEAPMGIYRRGSFCNGSWPSFLKGGSFFTYIWSFFAYG